MEYATSGIYFDSASGSLTNSTFRHNTNGIYINADSDPQVTDSTVSNNTYGVYIRGVGSSSGAPEPMLTTNTVSHNNYGFYVYGTYNQVTKDPRPVINGNAITDNSTRNFHTAYFADAVNTTLNARGNWWGSADPVVIAASIYDQNDTSSTIVPYVDSSNYLSSVATGQVAITSPAGGSEFYSGDTIQLQANASDVISGDLGGTIQWNSSINGALGTGTSIATSALSNGSHIITATIADNGGNTINDSVTISISTYNNPPVVTISAPTSAGQYVETTHIAFIASASDVEDGDLSSAITWTSDRDGTLANGNQFNTAQLSIGAHQIQASVEDSGETTSHAQLAITITENQVPTITVASPSSGSTANVSSAIQLQATAADGDEGDLSANINWYSNVDGLLGTGTALNTSFAKSGSHIISARVEDSHGGVAIERVLIDVIDPNTTAQSINYQYNGLGQRVSKTLNGVTTYFIYDTQGRMLAELDGQGNTTREYVYSDDDLVALVGDVGSANEQMYYVHNSHLGTPLQVTNQSQAVVWRARYNPFGEAKVVVNDIEQNIRFPGQYFDGETGLHYNYYRDYDPSLGRYLQSDPLGIMLDNPSPERQVAFEMGLDLPEADLGYINHNYGYADQNPVMYFDPSGENTMILNGGRLLLVPVPGARVIGGAMILGGIGVMCMSGDDNDPYTGHGENPEGKTGTGGNWDKHSGKRAGKRYGSGRNNNRGKKNKKYSKPKNPNKR